MLSLCENHQVAGRRSFRDRARCAAYIPSRERRAVALILENKGAPNQQRRPLVRLPRLVEGAHMTGDFASCKSNVFGLELPTTTYVAELEGGLLMRMIALIGAAMVALAAAPSSAEARPGGCLKYGVGG